MRKAFTLLEMLVVIGIISVLAALIFPAFARARGRAKCVQCISNLRQIGTAVGSYLPDWDEKYPWAYRTYDMGTTPTLRSYLRRFLGMSAISAYGYARATSAKPSLTAPSVTATQRRRFGHTTAPAMNTSV